MCADISAVMAEMVSACTAHFTIVYDVSHAHRQVPIEEQEGGRLGCQIKVSAAQAFRDELERHKTHPKDAGESTPSLTSIPFTDEQLGEEIWLNVGLFGVGSARYRWGRAGADPLPASGPSQTALAPSLRR